MRDHYVTRSGLPVRIIGDYDDPNPPSGSRRCALRAYSEGSPDYDRIIVEFEEYDEIKEWLRTEHQISLEVEAPRGDPADLLPLAHADEVVQLLPVLGSHPGVEPPGARAGGARVGQPRCPLGTDGKELRTLSPTLHGSGTLRS